MPNCEDCWNYNYDEETDQSYCSMDIDEDEWYRIVSRRRGECPFSDRQTIIICRIANKPTGF